MIILYGISNCDTVKKARRWLDAANIDYRFHDLRVDGLERKLVQQWVRELGWEQVVNRRSTSWKQLDSKQRDTMDDASAVEAILVQPTLVKRPVLDIGHERHLGFSAAQYQDIFEQHTL